MQISNQLRNRVIALLKEGKKINAIKIVQEETRLGLKKSKEIVDALLKEIKIT